MKANSRFSCLALAAAFVTITLGNPFQLLAQAAPVKSSPRSKGPSAESWSVQVDKVESGDVNLEPAFQVAIYESLLDELSKTKRFRRVIREGDRSAGDVTDLLILKTTIQKYTPGSETRRAVTTVSGATKLTVRSQLRQRDGHVVLERTINGNVRFIGSNLRATHNLARNVAKAIKQSSLPEPLPSASPLSGQILKPEIVG